VVEVAGMMDAGCKGRMEVAGMDTCCSIGGRVEVARMEVIEGMVAAGIGVGSV